MKCASVMLLTSMPRRTADSGLVAMFSLLEVVFGSFLPNTLRAGCALSDRVSTWGFRFAQTRLLSIVHLTDSPVDGLPGDVEGPGD